MAKKVRDSLLDEVFIASPCTVSWDSMEGDDRTRNCSSCSKNVYNLSEMTRKEAEEFISHNGGSQCITFYRRFDGTILTDDCPVGLRKIRDRIKLASRVAASVVAFLVSLPGAIAQSIDTKDTKPITNKLKPKINPPPKRPDYHQMLGGIMAPPRNGPMLPPPPANQPEDKKKSDSQTDSKDKSKKTPPENTGLAETQAASLYAKAKKAISAGKTDLGEFYLSKAIEAFDSQKATGDKQFRKKLADELSRIRLLNTSK